jgi:alanine dehydrogenase
MKIGIPREIKVKESRVACTPGGVYMLIESGHEILIEKSAGAESGFYDDQYIKAGARIVPTAEDAWAADIVIKVKEPMETEYRYLHPGLLLFTYLHLAADKILTQKLVETKTTGIAYETIQVGRRLPLLEPMSEIAGRMSSIVGANYLSKAHGGTGVLLSGVPGVLPGKVLVLGGGTAGINAGKIATGLGAEVIILEVDLEKIRFLDNTLHGWAHTLYSDEQNLLELLPSVDLLIGAVLVPGAKAPKLIKRNMLKLMRHGSVFVDISIDQGGCAETSHPTTHEDPTYVEENIIHYCVTNMPGAYSRTSTQALTNVTLPYLSKLTGLGLKEAIFKIPGLLSGVNTHDGLVTNKAVAEAHGFPYQELGPETLAFT